MKTAETKTTAAANYFQAKGQSQPFFKREGLGDGLFDERTPFFSKRSVVQAKLTIGRPGDRYEQEADQVAETVVRKLSETGAPTTPKKQQTVSSVNTTTPDTQQQSESENTSDQDIEAEPNELLQKKPVFESADQPEENLDIQRTCTNCNEEENVQAKSENTINPRDIENQLNSTKGSGSSLPKDTQSSMEHAFGANFSGVRVHTGSNAVHMNKGLGAQAFTHGSDIYFNEGKYDTSSHSGQHLLAHELTHTVQQGGAGKSGVTQTKIQRWPGWADSAASWVSDTASSAADSVVDGAKWVGGEVVNGARWVGNKAAAGASWVGEQISSAGQWVIDRIRSLINSGTDWLNEKWEGIKAFGSSCFEDIKNGFGGLVHFITTPLSGFVSALSQMDADILGTVWNSVKSGSNALWVGIDSVINGVLQVGSGLWRTALTYINGIFSRVEGLFDNSAFGILPDWLKREVRSLFNGLRTLWNHVSSFWIDLWNRLAGFVTEVLASVRSFVQKVMSFGIESVLKVLRNLKRVYGFVREVFADPMAYIEPLLARVAGKVSAEAPPRARGLGNQIVQDNSRSAGNGVPEGGVIQRQGGNAKEERRTATPEEVIRGVIYYLGEAVKKVLNISTLLQMLRDTAVNMFWPPATIKAIGKEFEQLWNQEWASTAASMYMPANFLESPLRSLHDIWSNFVILLEFPTALWRRLNNVLGLLMPFVTALVVIAGAVIGGFGGATISFGVGAPVTVPAGIGAGALAGLGVMGAAGEALMASFVSAYTVEAALSGTQLFTARQHCLERQCDMKQMTSSAIGAGVALALQYLMSLLSKAVSAIVQAIRGVGKAVPAPAPAPARPVPAPAPARPVPAPAPTRPVPAPAPAPARPVPAPAPTRPVPAPAPAPARPAPAPGQAPVIPMRPPVPSSPPVELPIAAKFEDGKGGTGLAKALGNSKQTQEEKLIGASINNKESPDIQTQCGPVDPDACKDEDDGLHTGTFADPIPINWYARPQDYPQSLTLNIAGRRENIAMFSNHSVYWNGRPPPGRPRRRWRAGRYRIGVSNRNKFMVGRPMQKKILHPRERDATHRFRDLLLAKGYRYFHIPSDKDVDHVRDHSWGGNNLNSNFWPLAKHINRRPHWSGGDWYNTYLIEYKVRVGDDWQRKVEPLGSPNFLEKWFKIVGFRYPPTPNPGGRD